MTEATGPLKGIRVPDLTTVVLGPFATRTMSDPDPGRPRPWVTGRARCQAAMLDCLVPEQVMIPAYRPSHCVSPV